MLLSLLIEPFGKMFDESSNRLERISLFGNRGLVCQIELDAEMIFDQLFGFHDQVDEGHRVERTTRLGQFCRQSFFQLVIAGSHLIQLVDRPIDNGGHLVGINWIGIHSTSPV